LTYVKQLLSKITPTIAVSILAAVITLAVAFGVNLTGSQKAAVLVFGGALSVVLFAHGLTNAFKYLTPPTLTGLVTTVIGVAISFGAPITKAQSEAILGLTALMGALLLIHGAVHTLARDKREPAPPKPVEVPVVAVVAAPPAAPAAPVGPTPEELQTIATAAASAAVAQAVAPQ
jgi:hypothetical protein